MSSCTKLLALKLFACQRSSSTQDAHVHHFFVFINLQLANSRYPWSIETAIQASCAALAVSDGAHVRGVVVLMYGVYSYICTAYLSSWMAHISNGNKHDITFNFVRSLADVSGASHCMTPKR